MNAEALQRIWSNVKLHSVDKLVMLAIASKAPAPISIDTIADMTSLSACLVRRSLKRLQERGELARVAG